MSSKTRGCVGSSSWIYLGRAASVAALAAAVVLSGCANEKPSGREPDRQIAPIRSAKPVYTDRVLIAFSGRVDQVRTSGVPTIIAAAKATATRMVDYPNACIGVPYGPQSTFAEEVLNRAGGLANALPPEERPKLTTPHDTLLVSARSWREDADKVRKMIAGAKEKGWLIILFASKNGMPADIKVDYLIDNYGNDDDGAVNSTTNIMNAWLWCAEYAAALTRSGRYPGVLYSAAMPGSDEHNKKIQTPEGRKFLGYTKSAIPEGSLATLYLASVDQLLLKLNDSQTQRQVEQASQAIAQQIIEGRSVIVATCTHLMMAEIFLDRKSTMKPIHVVWRSTKAFAENVRPGDTVFWIGYIGMSTRYENYFGAINATGARLVSSYVTDTDGSNNATDRLAHIEQHWAPPDAELAVPFSPGFIAPVSGIDQSLIFRMVDERVAAKVAKAGVKP